MVKKLNDIAKEIESCLPREIIDRLPAGLAPEVVFPRPGKKDTRRDADLSYFKPEDGHQITIRFVKVKSTAKPSPSALSPQEPVHTPTPAASAAAPPMRARLLRELGRAASEPGKNFVGLKWFRDIRLAQAGFDPSAARAELEAAIAAGEVSVSKLNNPHSPYPTATLQLNRNSSAVTEALNSPERGLPPRRGFAPLDLGGISLSEEVLRQRR